MFALRNARLGSRAQTRAIVMMALVLLVFFETMGPVHAAPRGALIVRNDRGGVIQTRVAEVAALRASGQRVEIHAGQCLSSCTLLLAVENLCISPRARFGFHGPSHYGQPLHPTDFEHWSQVIAAHYAPALRRWFLNEARYTTRGFKRLSGAELIRMGYPSC